MRHLALLIGLAGCSGVFSNPGAGELVTYATQPRLIALSGNDLYFVSSPPSSQDLVMRASKFPGGSAQLVAAGDSITAITADEHGVYWLDNAGGTTRMWAATPGGTAMLGTNPNFANGSTLRNIVSDGDFIYYADYTGTIWKVPVTGTGFINAGMTDTSAGAVAVTTGAIWVSARGGAKVIYANGQSQVYSFTSTGGDQDVPSALAFDAGMAFIAFSGTGDDDGYINSFTLSNVEERNVTKNVVLPSAMVASSGELYFVTGNGDAAVRAVPYLGGRSEALAIGHAPSSVVVDESYVYWTDPYPGEIRRAPRFP